VLPLSLLAVLSLKVKENIYMIMIFIIFGVGNIRNAILKVTNERNFEIAQCLQNLGINKSVAQLVAYLKDMNERSYRDIERAIGLRQPEVGIAMRFLRERGWITERKIGKDAKARASKIYALRKTLDEIITYYEEMEKKDSVRLSKSICRLKEINSSWTYEAFSDKPDKEVLMQVSIKNTSSDGN